MSFLNQRYLHFDALGVTGLKTVISVTDMNTMYVTVVSVTEMDNICVLSRLRTYTPCVLYDSYRNEQHLCFLNKEHEHHACYLSYCHTLFVLIRYRQVHYLRYGLTIYRYNVSVTAMTAKALSQLRKWTPCLFKLQTLFFGKCQ